MQNPDTRPTSTPDKKTSDYFNLHATGIGYLRRARTVTFELNNDGRQASRLGLTVGHGRRGTGTSAHR